MGWFWNSTSTTQEPDKFPVSASTRSEGMFSGVFWATPAEAQSVPIDASSLPVTSERIQEGNQPSKCPVDHTKLMKKKAAPTESSGPAGCPVDHTKLKKEPSSEGCPVDHSSMHSGSATKLNPYNNMPALPSSRAPGQTIDLPTERTISSIPRGETDNAGNWEYPSPQQMMNAMVRKSGREGIEEEAVESMVDVHNFLNEGVWQEVLEWEKQYTEQSKIAPRLLKFTGRPNDVTPRAQFLQWMGWIYPSKYGFPPPFDRHDWTVLRSTGDNEWQQVRYVIDFYEAPDEGDMPAFSVDVRPALDSFQSASDRIKRAAGPIWDQALGRD